MSTLRPKKRRSASSIHLDEPRTSRPFTRAPSQSIFALIDAYEDNSATLPPTTVENNNVQQNTEHVPVLQINESSDDEEWAHDPHADPCYCKKCRKKRNQKQIEGEGSGTVKKTPPTETPPKETPPKETPLKCAICLAPTTYEGDHQPHTLKCGHIFGYHCIKTWLDAEMPSTCPCCVRPLKDGELIWLCVTSAVDDMIEDAITVRGEMSELKEKHRHEKTKLIELNTMLTKCVKNFSDALAGGCGIQPNT